MNTVRQMSMAPRAVTFLLTLLLIPVVTVAAIG
jgi:hypothetical protein